jgi:uncharacterized membrane protein (TIGR02234 family)
MSDQSRRRELMMAVSLLAAGGIVGLVATRLPWGQAYLDGGGSIAAPGWEVAPLYQALPLFALAAAVAVLATRRVGRMLIGASLGVAALVSAYSSIMAGNVLGDRVRDWAVAAGYDVLGATGGSAAIIWYSVAGTLIFVAGVWIAVRGSKWPTMSRRYERGSARDEPTDRSTQSAWDALDRGDDPTI